MNRLEALLLVPLFYQAGYAQCSRPTLTTQEIAGAVRYTIQSDCQAPILTKRQAQREEQRLRDGTYARGTSIGVRPGKTIDTEVIIGDKQVYVSRIVSDPKGRRVFGCQWGDKKYAAADVRACNAYELEELRMSIGQDKSWAQQK